MEFFLTFTALMYAIGGIVLGIVLFCIGAALVIGPEDWGKGVGFLSVLFGKLLSFAGSIMLLLWIIINVIHYAKS